MSSMRESDSLVHSGEYTRSRSPGQLECSLPEMLCGRPFEIKMQFRRVNNGGCVEMRLLVGFCTSAALALMLLMFSDSIRSPDQTRIQNLLHLYQTNGSSTSKLQENEADCSKANQTAAATSTCYREWEAPSITREREWEKSWDESTPEEQRTFTPLGVSAFLFIQFGAYRGSPSNFSIVGLSPKALHVYGNPGYECFWIPDSGAGPVKGNATTYLPGIKLANQYTGTVIHCSFEENVGTAGIGGSLQIVANMGSLDRTGLASVQFIALTEKAGEYDQSLFDLPHKYDYMYCGSPLYGQISPQRVREWIAYHARTFGPRSHFTLYDAGGLHEDVRQVLSPWVKLGRVTIMNFRSEVRYDSHYHSQAVVVNDCLLQAKRLAEWAFFFDLDEYLYVPPRFSLDEVMEEIAKKGRKAQQVTFDQKPMNHDHCVKRPPNESEEDHQRQWGIEKLVFQRTQITEWGGWKDHKYAVQTRYMLAAGTHDHEFSLVPDGMDKSQTITYVGCEGCGEDKLHYHHYHNTINVRVELCKEFVDPWIKETKFNNVTHVYDNSIASLADAVRQFELETVGPQPFIL